MSDDTSKLLKACVEYRAMVDKLERENARLRKDKLRLDYLIKNQTEAFYDFTRADIDAAIKEAQT